MKVLVRHIETLLIEHDCVIVEGLGGFIANRMPAVYDADTENFLPPYRNVTFNQHLTENDGLLTQRYMQTFDAAYPEALRQQEKDVSQLCMNLDMNGEVQVGSIGLLKKDLTGRIKLQPGQAGIPTPELYGLSALSIRTLDKIEAEEKAKIIAMQPQPAAEPAAAASKDGQPAADRQPDKDTGRKRPEKFPMLIDFSIAAAVAAILFLLFSAPAIHSPRVEEDSCLAGTLLAGPNATPRHTPAPTTAKQQSSAPTATPAAAAKQQPSAPTATPAGQEARTEQTEKADGQPDASPAKQAAPGPANAEAYTIVLACHVSEKNAMLFIRHLTEKGFKGAEFVKGRVPRIVYGKYATEQEAARSLRGLRQENEDFASAWTMKINPTKA